MAQTYAMPPDTHEEENIIGGLINMHQLGWLIVGAGVGAFFTLIAFKLIGPVALILAFPPIGVGCVFAFKRVEDMTLFDYLRYKHRYNTSVKNYANFGNHSDIEVMIREDTEETVND